jgi:hypothetical protein
MEMTAVLVPGALNFEIKKEGITYRAMSIQSTARVVFRPCGFRKDPSKMVGIGGRDCSIASNSVFNAAWPRKRSLLVS